MDMLKSENKLVDCCVGCKKALCHGDRSILARNLKFFHFDCYARKNFLYRLVNPVGAYFIWLESQILDEFNDSIKKYVSVVIEKKNEPDETITAIINETATGEGDVNVEIHELEISKPVDIPKKEEAQNETCCGDLMDVTSDSEVNRVTEMEDSLTEIRNEVDLLKSQIVQFEEQRDWDKQMRLQLEKTVDRYLQNINELNRQNYYLRQESVLLHQKLKENNIINNNI